MPTNHDDMYRENLRKKLGLADSSSGAMKEVDDGKVDLKDIIHDKPGDKMAPDVEPESSLNPAAEAVLNEVLQFVDELEGKHSPRMVKALWVYLEDNKDKIAKAMVGKVEKAEKAI